MGTYARFKSLRPYPFEHRIIPIETSRRGGSGWRNRFFAPVSQTGISGGCLQRSKPRNAHVRGPREWLTPARLHMRRNIPILAILGALRGIANYPQLNSAAKRPMSAPSRGQALAGACGRRLHRRQGCVLTYYITYNGSSPATTGGVPAYT